MNSVSILSPSVYRDFLGRWSRYSCQRLYTATACSITGSKRVGGGGVRRLRFAHTYEDIISMENLLSAWREFLRGKRHKRDVQEFQYRLMDNIFALHRDLKEKKYVHGGYHHFKIS